jgi:putative salt-induced outer membrane protein YdiY
MVIKTAVAGEVTINLGDIQTFSTDGPIELHLADGTKLQRSILPADPNRFLIESGPTVQSQALRIADIVAINPPARPTPKWTGNISAGLTKTTGNTHIDNRSLSISAERRSENDRIGLNLDFAKGRQKDPITGVKTTIEDWWRGRAKYDYFVSKQLYVYGDGRYEKDAVADLDRRILVGGGCGYQWLETDLTKFRVELGIASLYEKFETAPEGNSELSIQAGYNFQRRLAKNLDFVNDLAYYPSTDSFSDYYLTTTAELRASLTPRMFSNLKVIFNYDQSPAPGRGSTDVKYIIGLGLGF